MLARSQLLACAAAVVGCVAGCDREARDLNPTPAAALVSIEHFKFGPTPLKLRVRRRST